MNASDVRYASGEVPEVGDVIECTAEQFQGGDWWISKFGDVTTVLRRLDGEWLEIDTERKDGSKHSVLSKWFKLLSRKEVPAHHPAPVSGVPKCEAHDWQPFDGEFKQGVEYRSRDGDVVEYCGGTTASSIYCHQIHNKRRRAYYAVTASGKYQITGTDFRDITHQRLRHAETGDGGITELPPIQLPSNSKDPYDPVQLLRLAACDPDGPLYGSDIVPWIDDVTTELAMLRKKVAAPAPQPAAGREGVARFRFDVYHAEKNIEYVRAADYDALQERCDKLEKDLGCANAALDVMLEQKNQEVAEANQRCEAAERERNELGRQVSEARCVLSKEVVPDSLVAMAKQAANDRKSLLAQRKSQQVANETSHAELLLQLATLTAERDKLIVALNQLADQLESFGTELRRQKQEAWMRGDLPTASRIAVLIGDADPVEHEKADLKKKEQP